MTSIFDAKNDFTIFNVINGVIILKSKNVCRMAFYLVHYLYCLIAPLCFTRFFGFRFEASFLASRMVACFLVYKGGSHITEIFLRNKLHSRRCLSVYKFAYFALSSSFVHISYIVVIEICFFEMPILFPFPSFMCAVHLSH